MSVYKKDNPTHFKAALESITDLQTIKPNEIVLVVDGPVSQEIDNVIDYFKIKCNMVVIRLDDNTGSGNANRVAVENCSYELVAKMDSDDISLANRFEQQLLFFEKNPNIDIVGGNISEFIGNEKNIVGMRLVPELDSEIKKYLKKRCPFNQVTVMFKKESVLKAGNYIEWHYEEDYYLWIRMLLAGAIFSNTGTTLVNVRVGKEMYSRRGGLKYFRSEKRLQKYMLSKRIIKLPTYIMNVLKRFIVQCLMPSFIRGWVFRNFARKKQISN